MEFEIGNTYPTRRNGNYKIIDIISPKKVHIRFIGTDYETFTDFSSMRKGQVKDYNMPTVYGKGYLGKGIYNTKNKKAYNAWVAMLSRCYNPMYTDYANYGGRGVTVCDSWLCFQHFAEWYIPRYFENCQLDKDILGDGTQYSPDSCKLVTPFENNSYAHAGYFCFNSPEGVKTKVYNLTKFCKKNGLNPSCMSAIHLEKPKYKSHKGWTKFK